MTVEQLAEVPLIRRLLNSIEQRYSISGGEMLRLTLVHELIDLQVSDVLSVSGRALAERGFGSSEAARRSDFTIGPGEELCRQKKELETFLYQRVYRHPRLLEFRRQAQDRLQRMFEGFLENPAWLPEKVRPRIDRVGLKRTIGEYLAGMTDRYCDQVYRKRFGG